MELDVGMGDSTERPTAPFRTLVQGTATLGGGIMSKQKNRKIVRGAEEKRPSGVLRATLPLLCNRYRGRSGSGSALTMGRFSLRASRRSSGSDERGASAVEFAILAPLFFMIVLGMFSGGLAFTRKIGVTSGVREGARFGATLPIEGVSANCASLGNGTTPDPCWFQEIRDKAISAASGDLNVSWSGQFICVSHINDGGTATRMEWNGNSASVVLAGACYVDTPASQSRVQVVGRRNTRFDALLWGSDLVLSAQAVARFEAIEPDE